MRHQCDLAVLAELDDDADHGPAFRIVIRHHVVLLQRQHLARGRMRPPRLPVEAGAMGVEHGDDIGLPFAVGHLPHVVAEIRVTLVALVGAARRVMDRNQRQPLDHPHAADASVGMAFLPAELHQFRGELLAAEALRGRFQPGPQLRVADARQVLRLQGEERLAMHGNRIAVIVMGQSVSGVVVKLAGGAATLARFRQRAVVRLVADDDAVDHRLEVVAKARPWRLDRADRIFGALRLAAARGVRNALQQAARGRADHRGIDRVMAVILAVLGFRRIGEVVVGQDAVEPPAAPQHLGHPPGDDDDMIAPPHHAVAIRLLVGIQRAEIIVRQPRQVLRIGELAVEEVAILLEPRHGVVGEAPALVGRQPLGAGEDVVVAIGPLRHLARRMVALLAIGRAGAEQAVGLAVVQRARPRQDVVDIDRAREQHGGRDHGAAVDAAAVERVVRIELLPLLEKLAVEAVVGLVVLLQEAGAALGVAAVPRVARGRRALLLLALVELARQLDVDALRLAVAGDQPVGDGTQLVKRDMHGRVGDASLADVVVVVGIVGAGRNPALQNLLIARQQVDRVADARQRVIVAGAFRRLGLGDDLGLQFLQHRGQRGRPKPAIAFRQLHVRRRRGLVVRQAGILDQPPMQLERIGLVAQLFDDLPLPPDRQPGPAVAEDRLGGQHGIDLVAEQLVARLALLVEARAALGEL